MEQQWQRTQAEEEQERREVIERRRIELGFGRGAGGHIPLSSGQSSLGRLIIGDSLQHDEYAQQRIGYQ